MRVEVTKSFRWAPDGNNVVDVEVGQVVEDRCAEVALQLGRGRDLEAPEPPAGDDDEPEPTDELAAEPQRNRAVRKAPRNKGA
jgi:hypothetical protein